MTCASCVKHVEKSVSALPSTKDVMVNLATEKLSLNYDKKTLDTNQIIDAVKKAGYQATIISDNLNDSTKRRNSTKQKEVFYLTLKTVLALVFAIPLLYLSMIPMLNKEINLNLPISIFINPESCPFNYGLIQLILVIPILIIGYKFYLSGFKNLIKFQPDMNTLIAIGTSSAFIYSLISLLQTYFDIQYSKINHDQNSLYFESVGIIITLVLLGKLLESVSKHKLNNSVYKLLDLTPQTAQIISICPKSKKDTEKQVLVQNINPGDIIIVRPGDKIPLDGVIIKGKCSVDQSMLTGESTPVNKQKDSRVFAGTVNLDGVIYFQATSDGSTTVLANIIKTVEEAQNSKLPIAKYADKVSAIFVPTVCLIAITCSIIWLISGSTISFSLTIFVSILTIACPCALGLATPIAIMKGITTAAKQHILFQKGEVLETFNDVSTIVFDKTGTLTKGCLEITDIINLGNFSNDELIKIASAVESASNHPIALAFQKYTEPDAISDAKNIKYKSGLGLSGDVSGMNIIIGNQKLLESYNIKNTLTSDNIKDVDKLSDEGKTIIFLAINNQLQAIIAIGDVLRDDSIETISKLKDKGFKVIMISGDNQKTAESIASKVNINEVIANVMPNEKANKIKELQKTNKVAFVGDGINDSPALTVADIGIAIGAGSEIAIESADIILKRSELLDIITALNVSKKTMLNIKQNIFWAFAYNSVGIIIGTGVPFIFGGPLLNPMVAAVAMSFSSISVLLNTLRLR